MTITKQWPSGSDNPTPTNFNIPEAGEKNWSSLTNFLTALAGGTQATTFQKIAIRQAVTTPVTVATNDCVVTVKLTIPSATVVNLPAGVAKQIYYIYDETGDASTNNITINRSGTDTIEGATSLTISTDKEMVGLIFDASASDWKVFIRAKPNIDVGSISGLGAGVATWLATPSSANLATAMTDETGSGLLVFNNAPTLIAPVLGTPASGDLSNCTNIPISELTGSTTGTGALVFATSPTLVTPNIGTPSAGDLSNCTNYPATGLSGQVPIANGGTGASAQTAAFDNLAPTTTKGDLVVNNGTNNVRLPVGTNGQYLEADSTQSTGYKFSNPSNTLSQNLLGDAGYTILDGDGFDVIVVGQSANLTAGRTVTLPTAADNTNRKITIIKADTGAFDVTVDGEGSEVVGPGGATTITLSNEGDGVTLICDGTEWRTVQAASSATTSYAGLLPPPSLMSDALATELGYKQYTSGFTVSATGWTTLRAVMIPYKMQGGEWRLKFNFVGNVAPSTTTVTVSISGITFKSGAANQDQGVAFAGANAASGIEYQRALGGTNQISLHETSAGGNWPVSGDVELDSKPSWAT